MKCGKQHIHDLPLNDVTTLGARAQQMQHEAEAHGEKLPPAIRLHIGEPNFRTPEHISRAAIESIQCEQLSYGPAAGWPWLRELLAEKIARVNHYYVEPGNVAVAVGGTGASQIALHALVGTGDEVLIPDPGWPHYRMQLACCGATPVRYQLDPQREWLPDMAQLEALVTPRTRLLIINNPSNPTGTVLPRELVAELLAFAYRHDLYLFSDECYDEMLFEGQHVSPASLLSQDEFDSGRVICIYSFSKTYSMTGWRIGYMVAGKPLIQTITTVLDASHTNVSTLAQRTAVAALTGSQVCVAEMCLAYRQRRDLVVQLLKDAGRYRYTPHGAFYVLIDVTNPGNTQPVGRQFVLNLLRERNVTVAAGDNFGVVAENYIRVSLAASDEEVVQGVREICTFAEKL